MPTEATEMQDVRVNRIALLPKDRGRKPANQRRVVCLKGAAMADTEAGGAESVLTIQVENPSAWEAAIKAALASDGLGKLEADVAAALVKADVSPEDATAIKGALRMLASVTGANVADVVKALTAMVGAGFPEPKKEPEEEVEAAKKPATKSAIVPLLKADGTADDVAIARIEDEDRRSIVKAMTDLAAENAKQSRLLKAERDERRRRDFVIKAQTEMPDVPGTVPEKTGALLLRCEDALPRDAFEEIVGIFKAASANAPAGLGAPRGTSARGGGSVNLETVRKAAVDWAKSTGQGLDGHAALDAFTSTPEGLALVAKMGS